MKLKRGRKKVKKHQTTDKEYNIFVTECKRLIEKFKLLDWLIYYELKPLTDAVAMVEYQSISRAATIKLNTKIDISVERLKEIALHEVCHLLFADTDHLACLRYVTESEITKAKEVTVHKIIAALKSVGEI